jgi:hypothetical protein
MARSKPKKPKLPRAVAVKKDLKEEVKPKEKKPDPPPIPKAIPSKEVTELCTAVAKQTATKYIIDRWWHLKRNREISAPRVVIDCLRQAGFVR